MEQSKVVRQNMKPKPGKESAERAMQRFKRARRTLVSQLGNRTTDHEALLLQPGIFRRRLNRIVAGFVLKHRLGISDPAKIKKIVAVFGQPKSEKSLDAMLKAMASGHLSGSQLKARHESAIDQTWERQKSEIKIILGRDIGERFWREFRRIREER